MEADLKKKRVEELLKKGVLISPEVLEHLNNELEVDNHVLVLTHESGTMLSQKDPGINWKEMDKARVLYEQGRAKDPIHAEDIAIAPQQTALPSDLSILSSHSSQPQKMSVDNFAGYFNTRYKMIERILNSRRELQNLTSISRVKTKNSPENISIIGMVSEKQETKNKNIMLTFEDTTGSIRVIISRNKQDVFAEAQDIVPDEVIGLVGTHRNGFFLATAVVFPDIPSLELKKAPYEGYAAFMSDLHFGSKQFMPDEFNRFLSWVHLETGNSKQKEAAEKLKYIMIAGDVVDGVGVYPDQQNELTLTDVKDQYKECAAFLSQIPEQIKVILAPGNHDAVRGSEPQPALTNEFCEPLSALKNVTLVSDPASFKIGVAEGFEGFNVLMYHGYSFDHYVANVDSIRQNGGYERGDLIMKFLLRKRHLAPTHTSTLIHPTPHEDALFIDTVPDFFVTGHIHRTSVSQYKSVSLINSSCWQSMTSFQLKLGHNPQPARLPLVNLKTRDSMIINFCR